MNQDLEQLVGTLRSILPLLRERFGVSTLAVFGSAARGQASSGSDVDVLVAFQTDAIVTLMTLAGLSTMLEQALGRRVDVVEDHPNLRPAFRREIEKDLLRVA